MRDAWIIGAHSTAFGRLPETTYKELTRQTYLGVVEDAGLMSGTDIEMTWFSNCGMWVDGQSSIRGQVCFTPLVCDGLFPERVPTVNVEGGCASAQMALHGAWRDVLSGQSELSLAIGVEKLFHPGAPERTTAAFDAAIDALDPQEWRDYYSSAGEQAGKSFEPGPDRTIFMDTYAMQACHHMKRYGTTQRHLAAVAAKNHNNGALNDKAQYRFEMSVDDVLEDRPITWPLTRSMCAPVGDGAASVLVCSGDYLATLPAAVRDRAVRIRASVLTGGKYRDLDEPGLSYVAAQKAYAMAKVAPGDIDLAEVHDATAFCEIYQTEAMGFAEPGRGSALVDDGETGLRGRIPVNTSGGLLSKGHPVGATGLSMIEELCRQLRGEAGPRQVHDPRLALSENGGGVIGFDEAACSVVILERS